MRRSRGNKLLATLLCVAMILNMNAFSVSANEQVSGNGAISGNEAISSNTVSDENYVLDVSEDVVPEAVSENCSQIIMETEETPVGAVHTLSANTTDKKIYVSDNSVEIVKDVSDCGYSGVYCYCAKQGDQYCFGIVHNHGERSSERDCRRRVKNSHKSEHSDQWWAGGNRWNCCGIWFWNCYGGYCYCERSSNSK